jgi:hypothetical protein
MIGLIRLAGLAARQGIAASIVLTVATRRLAIQGCGASCLYYFQQLSKSSFSFLAIRLFETGDSPEIHLLLRHLNDTNTYRYHNPAGKLGV